MNKYSQALLEYTYVDHHIPYSPLNHIVNVLYTTEPHSISSYAFFNKCVDIFSTFIDSDGYYPEYTNHCSTLLCFLIHFNDETIEEFKKEYSK